MASATDQQPQGLLLLTQEKSTAHTNAVASLVAGRREIRARYSAATENMVVGPGLVAPFSNMHLLEVVNREAAQAIVDGLLVRSDRPKFTALLGRPMPAAMRRVMRVMHFVFRRLPAPAGGTPTNLTAHDMGGVNPTPEQLTELLRRPQQPAVFALNLNLHKKTGVHPRSGETKSGQALAQEYFRRGMFTFSRLGARLSWAGSVRESLADELDLGSWDQIGLVYYPSRAAFTQLLQVPSYVAAGVFRKAGLERSWVVHCTGRE
jgi:hypothetical protein